MFRMAFNSSYFKELQQDFDKTMLDPDILVKDPMFPQNFRVRILLQEIDQKTTKSNEFREQEKGKQEIISILQRREKEMIDEFNTQILVFGDPDFDDRDEMQVVNMDEGPNHSDPEDGEGED